MKRTSMIFGTGILVLLAGLLLGMGGRSAAGSASTANTSDTHLSPASHQSATQDLVQAIAWSSDGVNLYIAYNSYICAYDLATRSNAEIFSLDATAPRPISAMDAHPSTPLLAIGDHDGQITLFDVAEEAQTILDAGDDRRVLAVGFSPDGHWLAATSSHLDGERFGRMTVLEMSDLQQPAVVVDEGLIAPRDLAFTRDSRMLAVSDVTRIHLWDMEDSAFIGDRIPYRDQFLNKQIRGVAFHPNRRVLAAGTEGLAVHFWDEDGNDLDVHASLEAATRVAFSPDGSVFAASTFNQVVVWRTYTETGFALDEVLRIKSMRSGEALGNAIAFSHDSCYLAFAHSDDVVLWNIETALAEHVVSNCRHVVENAEENATSNG